MTAAYFMAILIALIGVGAVAIFNSIGDRADRYFRLYRAALAGGFLVLAVFIFSIISSDAARQASLMRECMDDGRKNYECVSLLRRPSR